MPSCLVLGPLYDLNIVCLAGASYASCLGKCLVSMACIYVNPANGYYCCHSCTHWTFGSKALRTWFLSILVLFVFKIIKDSKGTVMHHRNSNSNAQSIIILLLDAVDICQDAIIACDLSFKILHIILQFNLFDYCYATAFCDWIRRQEPEILQSVGVLFLLRAYHFKPLR